jgi:UDP-N-acetyl-2-amino-2-deoxyglucuronate dehydrogenase
VTEPKLKFALAGCGYIGQRHLNLLNQHPACELVAVIDTDSSRLAPYQAYPSFPTLREYLASGGDAQVVIIATPNGTHAPLAIEALKNQKHVLIEKPMALTTADAQAVIQTAADVNRKAMVVLQNRFAPVSVWLKQLVESGALGQIFLVQVNCFWNRDERYYKKGSWHGTADMDGGTLFTQFSHFIDMLYWLFGEMTVVNSQLQNFNHRQLAAFEDTGSIQCRFQSGGFCTFSFTTAAWDKTVESNMTIIAENGSLKISGQYMDQVEYCHVRNYTLPALPLNEPGCNQYKMLDAVIQTVRHNAPANAHDALHSVNIIQSMYAAASEH